MNEKADCLDLNERFLVFAKSAALVGPNIFCIKKVVEKVRVLTSAIIPASLNPA